MTFPYKNNCIFTYFIYLYYLNTYTYLINTYSPKYITNLINWQLRIYSMRKQWEIFTKLTNKAKDALCNIVQVYYIK